MDTGYIDECTINLLNYIFVYKVKIGKSVFLNL